MESLTDPGGTPSKSFFTEMEQKIKHSQLNIYPPKADSLHWYNALHVSTLPYTESSTIPGVV